MKKDELSSRRRLKLMLVSIWNPDGSVRKRRFHTPLCANGIPRVVLGVVQEHPVEFVGRRLPSKVLNGIPAFYCGPIAADEHLNPAQRESVG